MARIPNDVIDTIRQQVDIVSVIGDYVTLTKRGTNYMCSCPFHEDRNPSFSVSPDKQIFKCFSCGRSGNVFGFLQEIEGISFVEAVQRAAEKSNIVLDKAYFNTQEQTSQPNQRLIALHQKAQSFYHFYLMETVAGQEALQYLLDRQLTPETLTQFQLGLAPDNSTLLVKFLEEAEFTTAEMLASGIFYEAGNQLLDRFRGRIIYPLANRQGQTVAFSGRVFQANPDKEVAKYVNTPETAIFHKSQLIYNFANARAAIRRMDQVLICEGYMDVIVLSQAGYQNAVATMGTSLTKDHVRQLSKVAQELFFVFDGDGAGQKATARAFEMTLPLSRHTVKAIQIPNKLDPDEWIRQKGAASFQTLVQQAVPRYEFLKDYLIKEYNIHDVQQRAQYIAKVLQLIAAIPSSIEQEMRLQDLGAEYGLDAVVLKEQFEKQRYEHERTSTDSTPPTAPPPATTVVVPQMNHDIQSTKAYYSERYILRHLIYYEAAWQWVASLPEPIYFVHDIAQNVYFQLQNLYYERGQVMPLTSIINTGQTPEQQQYLTSLIWEHTETEYSDKAMNDSLRMIQKAFVEIELAELQQKLKTAQANQNHTKMNEYLVEILRLNRQLKQHIKEVE